MMDLDELDAIMGVDANYLPARIRKLRFMHTNYSDMLIKENLQVIIDYLSVKKHVTLEQYLASSDYLKRRKILKPSTATIEKKE